MRSRSNADRARALWGMKGNFLLSVITQVWACWRQHADRSAPEYKGKEGRKKTALPSSPQQDPF